MAHELSQDQLDCLRDIFCRCELEGTVEALRYRAEHVGWMDVLDRLVHSQHARLEGGKYRVSLDALPVLGLPAADAILKNAERIFSVFKQHYFEKLSEPLAIGSIALQLEIPAYDVAKAIFYMLDNAIWQGGGSLDVRHDDAFVCIDERSLKFATFADVIVEQQSWSCSGLAVENPFSDDVSVALGRLGSSHVVETWSKALERRRRDPAGAITAARSLLEAVCKTVLDHQDVAYEESADLRELYRVLTKSLELNIDRDTDSVFKQILSGCHSVVQGVGSMRNRLGDSHGKGMTMVQPAPRHAELAVNLAGTMALFLVQTWEARGRP